MEATRSIQDASMMPTTKPPTSTGTSRALPLNPSFWYSGSLPASWTTTGLLKSPVRSRCVSQDQKDNYSPNTVFDVYPNVQEIQDDIILGGLLPPLPGTISRNFRRSPVVPRHLRARSVGTPAARCFADDYVLTRLVK